jgi:drug/metabolite transporter (DMT)-like permease
VLVGALLLYVTSSIAHRPVTTELPLIVVWATAQFAAGITLWTAGVLAAPAASAWIVATATATLVGLVCYLIFYRLTPVPAYWIGMVPLAVDGVVAASLAAVVTLTRVQ